MGLFDSSPTDPSERTLPRRDPSRARRRQLDPSGDVGLSWVVGVPHSGKTTYALSVAYTFAREKGVPLVVLDCGAVDQCAGIALARTVPELVRAAWGERRDVRFVPESAEDVDEVCAALERGKDVAFVVDEANHWLSAQSRSSGLLRIMRKTQHVRVRAWFTTQHLSGDVPQTAISCAPELVVFRCTSRPVLDMLEKQYGLDPRTVAALPRGAFLRVTTGFGFSP